jgi:3-deoxy-D-manno-octulosonate 8-phosphate phosphatase (KDO 8-P phosphatase)
LAQGRSDLPERKEFSAADIRVVATDIDGTLTDGGMFHTDSGETFKRFNVRDGLAVKLLQTAGFHVVWISSDASSVITSRAERLGVAHCYTGVSDKATVMQKVCEEVGEPVERAAFLGDDLQDLAVMRLVGYPAAVADAHDEVKKAAVFECASSGGQGAFRELAEHLIRARGDDLLDVWERSNQR